MHGVQLVVKIFWQPVRAASQKRKMLRLYNYLSEIILSSCKICRCCIYHDHSWASYITLEALSLNAIHNGPETAVSSGRSSVHECTHLMESWTVTIDCVRSQLLRQPMLNAWPKVSAAGELPWTRNNGRESCRLRPTTSDGPNLSEHSNLLPNLPVIHA